MEPPGRGLHRQRARHAHVSLVRYHGRQRERRQGRLQQRQHAGRPRGAQDRSRRELVDHADGRGAELERAGHQRVRSERRRSRAHALLSRELQRPLGTGRADRAGQDRQFRYRLCVREPQSRRRLSSGLQRLLVLVRHAVRLRRVHSRQRRKPDQSRAAHHRQGRLPQDQQRAARLLAARGAASASWPAYSTSGRRTTSTSST